MSYEFKFLKYVAPVIEERCRCRSSIILCSVQLLLINIKNTNTPYTYNSSGRQYDMERKLIWSKTDFEKLFTDTVSKFLTVEAYTNSSVQPSSNYVLNVGVGKIVKCNCGRGSGSAEILRKKQTRAICEMYAADYVLTTKCGQKNPFQIN